MTQNNRITLKPFFHAGEYLLDGEAVCGYSPLDKYDGKVQFSFKAGSLDQDFQTYFVAYEITDYLSGAIHYAQHEDLAKELAWKIAKAYLA